LALLFLALLATTYMHAADKITLSGRLSQAICPAACGICCGSYLLHDTSGIINLNVGIASPT